MSLSGTFDTMLLSDLLQWIHLSMKSGTLSISVDIEETFLFFRKGVLAALGSDDPLRLDLGQVLLARSYVTEEQLSLALENCSEELPVVAYLMQEGILDEALITKVQADHAFDTVLDLFFHEEGSFHFSTKGSSQNLLAPLDDHQVHYLKKAIDTKALIFEGMQRLDEWKRIKEVFPNSYVVVHGLEGDLDNPVWQELRAIDKPIAVGELCLRMGSSRFYVFQKLYEAYNLGLVGLDLMPSGNAGQEHLGPSDMLMENARILVREQQYDEAKAVLSTAINIDPDNEKARELMQQIRSGQLEYLYQQMPPHQTPTLAVAREQLDQFDLNPREAFLASRLNGKWDVATLIVITPLGELETLRILRKFLHAGIIKMS